MRFGKCLAGAKTYCGNPVFQLGPHFPGGIDVLDCGLVRVKYALEPEVSGIFCRSIFRRKQSGKHSVYPGRAQRGGRERERERPVARPLHPPSLHGYFYDPGQRAPASSPCPPRACREGEPARRSRCTSLQGLPAGRPHWEWQRVGTPLPAECWAPSGGPPHGPPQPRGPFPTEQPHCCYRCLCGYSPCLASLSQLASDSGLRTEEWFGCCSPEAQFHGQALPGTPMALDPYCLATLMPNSTSAPISASSESCWGSWIQRF